MIVPDFWAEARIQERVGGRRVTVRRFGWSDTTLEDAQANADARAREAFDRIAAGEKLPRSEPKLSYNGAEGVPIREQVISRHDDVVVTRNIYGARCLNTPDVLFVDIDFVTEPTKRLIVVVAAVFMLGAGLGAWLAQAWLVLLIGLVAAVAWSSSLAGGLQRRAVNARGGHEARARVRIDGFLADHPDWHLRLYRTPAGLRVLAMQRSFDPRGKEVAECFDALGSDPLYVRMCRHQNCFRARVSAKPWRIGIDTHIKPRPGVWPINPAKMPGRSRWIDDYEQAAQGYAACRFVQALGSNTVDPKARRVQQLHDQLCRADSDLPVA